MIQRIQTVYLLVVAIIAFIMLFLPFGELTTEHYALVYNAFSVKFIEPISTQIISTVYIALELIAIIVLSIITIFMYKNRKRQMQAISVNMLLVLITILTITYIYPELLFSEIKELQDNTLKYNLSILIFGIPVICLILAKKAIAKDEALLKSADRLR